MSTDLSDRDNRPEGNWGWDDLEQRWTPVFTGHVCAAHCWSMDGLTQFCSARSDTLDSVAAALAVGMALRQSPTELAALAIEAYEANPPEWLIYIARLCAGPNRLIDGQRPPSQDALARFPVPDLVPESVRLAAGIEGEA